MDSGTKLNFLLLVELHAIQTKREKYANTIRESRNRRKGW